MNEDGSVVWGTGEGKSIVFMVPAFDMVEKVCVVFVPCLALQNDI